MECPFRATQNVKAANGQPDSHGGPGHFLLRIILASAIYGRRACNGLRQRLRKANRMTETTRKDETASVNSVVPIPSVQSEITVAILEI